MKKPRPEVHHFFQVVVSNSNVQDGEEVMLGFSSRLMTIFVDATFCTKKVQYSRPAEEPLIKNL